MSVPFDHKVKATDDTLINVIGGESVLLNLNNESYYGLDEVGTRMWTVLTNAASIQTAYESLLNEYDVAPEVLRCDLTDLLEKLAAQGLVEIGDEQVA